MEEEIKVSVMCLVYNHEKYLNDCLSSLVNQKTNFNYEVIVHDDASVDESVKIIKEYAQKYPKLIKPILQVDNQFSKGVIITKDFFLPMAKGKYIAFCEGDDFWIDENKLQKQYDALEAHSECMMCVHKVKNVNQKGEDLGTYHPNVPLPGSCAIESKDFIKLICESYAFQTSSYFFNADKFRQYFDNIPAFRKLAPVGDQAYLLYFGDLGSVYYIDEAMSCYRNDCEGSFSEKFLAADRDERIKFYKQMIAMYKEYNQYTKKKYEESCNNAITKFQYYEALYENKYDILIQKRFRKYLKKEMLKSRLYFYFWGTIRRIKG